jgi:hypothetical protein
MRRASIIVTLGLLILASGCGNSMTHTVASHPSIAIESQPETPAALEQAVRKAIQEDHRLSVEALWTNSVPANPPATAGPDLAILRQSVAQRRRQGVRVKMLAEHLRILSVQLDPSYTTATATVLDVERVQPSYPSGRPRGKPSATREHAHLELRRVGKSERFVVWKVTLLS